jgi:manganese/iron transport system permease protein
VNALIWKWLLAGLLGGAGCGLVGFLLVAMNLPFMGVCLAHAALAGAVLAYFLGTPILATALVVSLLTAAVIGPLADRARVHANTMMSILFSLMLGLAFLGIGLMRERRAELFGLMWGNLLLAQWSDIAPLFLAWVLPLALIVRYRREVQATLFDREIARASGIHAAAFYYLIIVLCGFAVTVNLNIVGGLMLYSLLTNPAVAALQLGRRYGQVIGLAMGLGALSAVGGLAVSWALDWPAGASIVVVSSAVYLVAALIRLLTRRGADIRSD